VDSASPSAAAVAEPARMIDTAIVPFESSEDIQRRAEAIRAARARMAASRATT